MLVLIYHTLPETNMALENRPSQKESSLPTIHFQGRTVSFREGKYLPQESTIIFSDDWGIPTNDNAPLSTPTDSYHLKVLEGFFISSKGVMKYPITDPWAERYIYLSMNGLIGMVNLGTYTVPFVPWIPWAGMTPFMSGKYPKITGHLWGMVEKLSSHLSRDFLTKQYKTYTPGV